MPEVIEIKKYADFIKYYTKNDMLLNIKILKGRYKTHQPFKLYHSLIKKLPIKINDIKTKGKLLYFVLDNGNYIISTLGLHGGWVIKQHDKENYKFCNLINYVEEDKMDNYHNTALNNLNVEFVFKNYSLIYFDLLSFGTLKILKNETEMLNKLKLIGPDIMDEITDINIFTQQLNKKNNIEKEIGVVLLNQKIISGIGNYLRADILWLSKISPFRKIKNLTNEDILHIFTNSKILTWNSYNVKKGVMYGYIKKNTILPNKFKTDFFVYNKLIDVYNNKVIKEELGGRYIYWVKSRQI